MKEEEELSSIFGQELSLKLLPAINQSVTCNDAGSPQCHGDRL